MKNNINTLNLLTATLITLIFAGQTLALSPQANDSAPTEPTEQCSTMLRSCYSEADISKQSNCLFSSAKHPFCEGTSLGTIAFQRWLMTPTESAAPSFLGPKVVNKECIKQFDADFLNILNSEQQKNTDDLTNKLKSCTQPNAPAN